MRAAAAVLLPVAGLLAGGFLAWPHVRDAVRRHQYFAVREVAVRGNRRLDPDEVRRAAGIAPGMSIWDVNASDAEARLDQHAWVRRGHVRRDLPHRVVIQVREERPVAILSVGDAEERPYYVAAHGRIFARVAAADSRDFPYLTGLAPAELREGESFAPRALRRALRLIRLAGRRGPGVEAVSEVHIDRARGLTLLPVRPPIPIEVGWGGFETKLARLPAVMALWKGREGDVMAVSLLWPDEVVVRTRSARRAVPARRSA